MNLDGVLDIQVPQGAKDVAPSHLELLKLTFDPDSAKFFYPVFEAF